MFSVFATSPVNASYSITITNSVPTISDCTIGPDGKHLDTKDIQWYKDVDSLEPINQAATPSSTTTASSSATIHPIFRGGPPPAVVVAGAHCSGCAVHPSNRITDPDNAKTLSSNTMHKCKASGSTDSNESDDYEPDVAEHPATTSDGKGGDTELDEDFDLAYASTKAMGDADHEVGLSSSL
ncbi:hypothetical protein L208DRAFT_1232659 [Tricholoma matsutake]|nr:hypothetical protein L208DRAFT_1232659 [Tricholoma matsutake 945]